MTRQRPLAAKDTSGRVRALIGRGRAWPLRYAYSTHTGSRREGRRNGLIPCALCDGRRADITRQIPGSGGAMKVRAGAATSACKRDARIYIYIFLYYQDFPLAGCCT